MYAGVPHYAISSRDRQAHPPTQALTSANAERLTPAEIVDMITRYAVTDGHSDRRPPAAAAGHSH